VCEGIIQGGSGAILALVLLRAGLDLARPPLAAVASGLVDGNAIQFLSAGAVALILLGGMLVGCVGGLVAARRLR